MALENYRPIQFPEKTELDSTDVVLIDSATNGTNKYQLNRITAQASAETTAAVAAEAEAREAADGVLDGKIGTLSNLTTDAKGSAVAAINEVDAHADANTSALSGKVDKVAGKGLSKNDFTDALKTKLDGIEAGAEVNDVTSVAGKTGAVTLAGGDVSYSDETTYADGTVGAAIADVKSDLTVLNDAVGIYVPQSASGTTPAVSNPSAVLSNVTLIHGHTYKYEVTYDVASDAASYLSVWLPGGASYASVKTIAAGETTGYKEYLYAGADTNAAELKITSGSKALKYTVKITDLNIVGNNISRLQSSVSTLENDVDNLQTETETLNHLTIINEAETTTKDITDQLDYTVGSMNVDGSTTSSSDYYYTEKIPVSEGDIVFTTSQYTRFRIVTAFNGSAVVAASGAENVFTYTVPSGVDGVVVTIYANQSRTYGTINLTGFGKAQNILASKVKNAERNHSHTYAKRHPMITFIDDDGNVEFYQYLLPMMQTYGIPMVSAYMGDANPDMQSNADMMTKAQCDEVVKAGGELIVHCRTDATTLTISQAEAMILKSKEVLEKYGFGKASRLLAYSNGTSNTDIRDMVSKHFDCAFSGAYPRVSNSDRSNHGCIVQYAIHREPCGGLYYDSTSTTLQYFKDMIDECIASNGWLVFTMHSWLMPEGQRQSPFENVDQFGLLEDIIEYIQELQTGGSDVEIVTASKGLDVFGNAWQAGDYLGHWNEETLTNTPTIGDHSQPGCAMNKIGQYDFPSGNAL